MLEKELIKGAMPKITVDKKIIEETVEESSKHGNAMN